MFFVNAPFVFRAIWGMITPWLHPVTKEKTYILGNPLKEFQKCGIPLSAIPKALGGECDPVTLTSLIQDWRVNGAPVRPAAAESSS